MNFINKYKVSFASFGIFVLIGLIVWAIRDIRYFFLFSGIGIAEFVTRVLVVHYPNFRQFFRLATQLLVGGFLLVGVSMAFGVNFYFEQVFFDMEAGVVTGALIQLVIARMILPLFLGNAFCSRACWCGFYFDVTNVKKSRKQNNVKRSDLLAWLYLICLIALPFVLTVNPADDEVFRKKWIAIESMVLLGGGSLFTFFAGSRAYCRLLCPFITISGVFSRFSVYKITPVLKHVCTQCAKCTEACPMLIDVRSNVIENKKIDDKLCVVCERCVSACEHDVLRLTNKK